MRHLDQIRADLGTWRTLAGPKISTRSKDAARQRLLCDVPHLLAAAEAVNRLCDDLEATGDTRDDAIAELIRSAVEDAAANVKPHAAAESGVDLMRAGIAEMRARVDADTPSNDP